MSGYVRPAICHPDRLIHAHGLCRACYKTRWSREHRPKAQPKPSSLERALSGLDRSGECWIWTKSRNTSGYGVLNIDGKPRRVHRVVYEAMRGPVPEGFELDHLCRNTICANPDHLEAVTHRENMLRSEAPAIVLHRIGRCGLGHEKGPGRCPVCDRARRKERWRKDHR